MSPNAARPTMSAGALLRDGDQRYLIVKPGYKEGWNLPGGGVDAGETPEQAARRELREEIAVDQEIGRLLVCAYVRTADREHIYWVFDGGTLTEEQKAGIVLQESELTACTFRASDEIGAGMIPPSIRPVWDAALTALADNGTVYLELAK
ncbi:NUDIX hydrolase [Streptomyces abyssalis]|uniref:NUDIX hydrolase n=1 Tax=Streptomyces abyssalis TaxID=933944 RepID=A0A1E7JH22_9ACTN|nr:NUDIX hydrolase [Streptomyces abyssalis]OEU85786.1 NUDIX hydrolase [Streptomyces abyssalis]OEU92750.1 NUDIX hydrolase [Streptomyces abyssalis]OEV29370.1 NUDIX hydrolase [Streptomyces nanshensis]